MKPEDRDELLNLIDEVKVVSFDVFDTLLYRKVNTPETIHELVGKHFGVIGFKKLRSDAQNEVRSRMDIKDTILPGIDEIYNVLAEHKEYDVDWTSVKAFEEQMEKDALVANSEIADIYDVVKSKGKRIIAITDTCFDPDFIKAVLEENGFDAVDMVYCSCKEKKSKSDKELFMFLKQEENVEPSEILHIGDDKKEDLEIPQSMGIKSFLYRCDADMQKIKSAGGSDIDKALVKILCDDKKGFQYNLGVEVGGPLYMGLINWIEPIIKTTDKDFCFLSGDGYNLYNIFKEKGYKNVKYLDISEDSLLEICRQERPAAEDYLRKCDLLGKSSYIFECGFTGKTQYLLEKVKESVGCEHLDKFFYFGILNSDESRKNLRGKHYETYLFDHCYNYYLQYHVYDSRQLYKLFFSAPEESESGSIYEGIRDFIRLGVPFAEKYDVELLRHASIGHFRRLLDYPTLEEATTIGGILKENYEKNNNEKKDDNGYHLENPLSIRDYERWMRQRESKMTQPKELSYNPSFSVVVPVYNVVTEQLKDCINSVLGQTYENYELILVDDCSTWPNVREVLESYEGNPKIKVIYRAKNGHISESTNDGIRIATGDFIVFSDCDDMLDNRALYSFAEKLNENPELDFIYSDEDKLTEDGKIKHMPFFKPDWSPNLFMTMNYTNHLSVYRASLVKKTGGLRSAYNGSQDYDFVLRFMELTDNKKVGHIPDILYHWRERKESVAYAIGSKNYAVEAAKYAKEDAFRRRGIKASLEIEAESTQYRPVYETVGNPKVSIVIPSKDHPDILKQCVDSICIFTEYTNYEIIVVDNGSNAQNRLIISSYLNSKNAKYIYEPAEFNFSYMCNRGAKEAEGDYILFLNDDIEVFRPDWLYRMLGQAMQPDTGAVGAKLYYPWTTQIQHEGVINRYHGPQHMGAEKKDDLIQYFGRNRLDYDCIAVTGACLLLNAEKFREVDGFDETFPIAYNDVDLCFKLLEKGYYNIIRNDAVLYHHESLSRGTDQVDEAKLLRLGRELETLYLKHPKLKGEDPFVNPNIYTYAVDLDLVNRYDVLTEVSLEGAIPGGMVYIDSVSMGDEITVRGWSYIEGRSDIKQQDRFILLEDPFGKVKRARVSCEERGDIAEAHPEWEDAIHCGFEFVISKKEIRADIIPYQLGVMFTTPDGEKIVCWCGKMIQVERDPEEKLQYADYSFIDEKYKKAVSPFDTKWYIDESSEDEYSFLISGFAFADREDHYKFNTRILLVDNEENVREYTRQVFERADVAAHFGNRHFLFNTGFRSLISKNGLDKDKTYKVVLRLENKENTEETADIDTGIIIG